MAWQFIIREGLSLSAMARLGELALALGAVPQSVRLVDGAPHWLRLFTSSQQQLLYGMLGPPTERTRTVWCGSGATMPAFPAEGTWCVVAEDALSLAPQVAERYERVIALVDGVVAQPNVAFLPGCAATPPVPPSSRRILLLIACGRPQQDAALLADLQAAGVQDIAILDPYAQNTCHGLERQAMYARSDAVIGVNPFGDDYFLQEAKAANLLVLRGTDPIARQQAVRGWLGAHEPAAAASHAFVSWEAVAQRCMALANTLPLPSGDQIQKLLTKLQTAGHLPTVLLKAPVRPPEGVPSDAMVGFSAASDSICQGLSHQARANFNLRWLLNTPEDVGRRRLYYYPYQSKVGIMGDELDFARLPAALRNSQLDMLCTTQSYTHGLVAARAAWATRPLPVLGMLHAVHASALASETLLQLLDGPSLPCDAFLSPTACGVEAHRRLMEAATAHLGQTMAQPPHFAGSYHVIPYGIDRTPFLALHPRACRLALNLPAGVPMALCLGRFLRHEKADLMPLLLAWKDVVRDHPEALLLLAGSHDRGTYARHIEGLCAELGLAQQVRFFENVSTCDKHLLFGASDFFITVSDNLQETYGLTVIEAMASGLPVVAAGWDGYRESVLHNETGFLIPTYMAQTRDDEALLQRIAEGVMGAGHRDVHESVVIDVQALAQALRTLVAQPELRQRMGETARATCAAQYDQNRQAKSMCDLFVTLIAQAQHVPWSSPPRPAPFRDRITERFAHYASHGYLQEYHCVAMSPSGAEGASRRRMLQQVGWGTPEVCDFADAVCARLVEAGGDATIKAALDGIPGDRYLHMLQVARLLKYGILRFSG